MAEEQNQGHRDLVHELGTSIKAIEGAYKEEGRELKLLLEEARHEAAKHEPNGVKLKALLADANEMARTISLLDPVWVGVQRVAKMLGFL